jgi:hypothetical protein
MAKVANIIAHVLWIVSIVFFAFFMFVSIAVLTDTAESFFGSDALYSQVDVPIFTNIDNKICIKPLELNEIECFFRGSAYRSPNGETVIAYDSLGYSISNSSSDSVFISVSANDGVVLIGPAAMPPMNVEALFIFFGIFWIVHQLRGITKNSVKSQFYNLKNTKHIRRIAYYLLALPVFYFLTSKWKIGIFESEFSKFNITGIQITPGSDFQLIYVVFGLVVLILAMIFANSARLKEEQALTI